MNQKDCILFDTNYKVETPLLTNRGEPNTKTGRPQGIYIGHAVGGPSLSNDNVTVATQSDARVEFKPSDTNRQEQKLMKLEWVVLEMLDRAELNNQPYVIAQMRLGSQQSFDKDIWSNNKAVQWNIPVPLKVPKFPTLGDSADYNLPSDCKCIPPQLSSGYWTEPSAKPTGLPGAAECVDGTVVPGAPGADGCDVPPSSLCIPLPEGRYFIIQEPAGEVSIDLQAIEGEYTLPELGQELEALLNAQTISNTEYTVQYDGLTNKFTIRGNNLFKLKFGTGSNQEDGAYYFFGFSKTDSADAYSHTSKYAFPPLKTVTVTATSRTFRVREKIPSARETAEFEVVIPALEYTYADLANKIQEGLRQASLQHGILKQLGGHTGFQYIVTFDPAEAKFHIRTCEEQEKFSLLFQLTSKTNKLPRLLGFENFNTVPGNCADSDASVYPVDIVAVPNIIPYVSDRTPIPNPTDIQLNDWGTVYLDDTYYCTQRVLTKPDELFYMRIVKSDGSEFRKVTNPFVYLPCNHPLKQYLPDPDYVDTCDEPFKVSNLYRFAALVSFQNVPLGYSNADKNGRVPPPIHTENINAPVQGQYVQPPLIQDGRATASAPHPY